MLPQNPIPLRSFSIGKNSQGEAKSAEGREKGRVFFGVGQCGIVSDEGNMWNFSEAKRSVQQNMFVYFHKTFDLVTVILGSMLNFTS